MDHTIAVVFCCEYGVLEKLTCLMVRSLREFGRLDDSYKLFCFVPRKRFKPSRKTLAFLENLQVQILEEDLNTAHTYYPLLNKPSVMAYAESHFDFDYLVFLDSDCCVFNAPLIPENFLNGGVAVQREYDHWVSAFHPSDRHYSFWKFVFNQLGVDQPKVNFSFLHNREQFAYWNSGFFVARAGTGLMGHWNQNLRYFLERYLWKGLEYYFLEQVTFSATIQQLELPVDELPLGYNYPISLHSSIVHENRLTGGDELVVAHYLKDYRLCLEALRELNIGEKVWWLENQFEELGLINDSVGGRMESFCKTQRNMLLQKLYYLRRKVMGKNVGLWEDT